jgi:arsenate reductase-like glutaredoxin family protein
LAVNDCLEDKQIKDLLKKCRAIETLFRKSTKSNEKLKIKQEKTNLNELKLIQDV